MRGMMSLPKSCEELGSSASAMRMGSRSWVLNRSTPIEAYDAPIVVRFQNAESFAGLFAGHFERSDGDVGLSLHVLLEHLLIIHFVNVIARQYEDVVGLLAADGVDILVHRVGGALIPML